MKNNEFRWGIVTFCVGITCGVIGHYIEEDIVFAFLVGIIFFFTSWLGAIAIED